MSGIEAQSRPFRTPERSAHSRFQAFGLRYNIATLRALEACGPFAVPLTIKKGGYAGLAVDSRRGGSAAWVQIGVSLSATYVDSRPALVAGQPEVREYRVQGLDGNTQVGDPSDTVSVSTTP